MASQFIAGKSIADYEADILLKSGVERQLQIAGEALGELRRIDASSAAQIPDLTAAVGLRNVLVHGYAVIDDAVVWRTVVNDVPPLLAHLRRLIGL